MDFEIEAVGDVSVITLGVDTLEASNAHAIGQSITSAIEGRTSVVIDLSAVTFVDSSGLQVFITCLKRLRSAGGDLKLCGMAQPVREIFELVRLHRIIDILDDRAEAIRSFQA